MCVKTLEFIILSAVCAGGTPNLFLATIPDQQAKHERKLGSAMGERSTSGGS